MVAVADAAAALVDIAVVAVTVAVVHHGRLRDPQFLQLFLML